VTIEYLADRREFIPAVTRWHHTEWRHLRPHETNALVATDERGQELKQRRINGNTASGFAQFFSELGEESKVVMEACWNWGWLHDLLGEIDQVGEVVPAPSLQNPLDCRSSDQDGWD